MSQIEIDWCRAQTVTRVSSVELSEGVPTITRVYLDDEEGTSGCTLLRAWIQGEPISAPSRAASKQARVRRVPLTYERLFGDMPLPPCLRDEEPAIAPPPPPPRAPRAAVFSPTRVETRRFRRLARLRGAGEPITFRSLFGSAPLPPCLRDDA